MNEPKVRPILPVVRIERTTMQDDGYRQAKALILDGEVVPGQLITIQWLADAFGVSPMPVREATRRLVAEKALTVVSGRTLGIPHLTRARLDDITRVRLEVEGLAVTWASPRLDGAILKRLDDVVDQMDCIAPDRAARRVYLRANREFHFTLYRATESDVLLAIIESLWLQISPYFNLLHKQGTFADSNKNHRAVVHALRDGNSREASSAIRNDIRGAADILKTQIAE